MGNLLSAHTGAVVRVRRSRWRVVEVRTYDQCQLITLSGIGHTNAGVEQRVVAPFDLVEPVEYRGQPRVVRRGTWRRVCRALIADDAPAGALRTLGRARLDLFPHQLEPALAIVGGLGSRVLLADEVGLGKTLQAGLIVSELRARGVADRVLILTPSGLRDQWADELRERLEIDATIVDAVALRRMVSMLPVGVNPWSTQPISIVSVGHRGRRRGSRRRRRKRSTRCSSRACVARRVRCPRHGDTT
jgi:hypothetical protein